MANLQAFTRRVEELVPDAETDLDDVAAIENAIDAALWYYSRLRPEIKATDLDGDGSTYTWSLPSDFYEFSKVVKVEYDQGEQIPDWLDPVYYTVYEDLSNGSIVRGFRMYITPSSGETVRVYYTTRRSADTVPDSDFEALCQLAAYYLCSSLAAKYASRFDSNLEAQILNYRTHSDVWRSLANNFMTNFKAHMGMREGDIVPSAAKRRCLIRADSIFRGRL